ncbi:Ribosomal L18p/L5e family protein [Citrus sinensis]|nr:Ribosomal L18p/L5e family protein [Citrus sinensis]
MNLKWRTWGSSLSEIDTTMAFVYVDFDGVSLSRSILQVVLVPVALGLGLNTYAKTVVIFLRPVMSFVAMVPHCALVALLQSTEGEPEKKILLVIALVQWALDFLDDDNSWPYTYKKEKKSKNTTKHISFKQRTVAYIEPFTLDVFISKRFVSASLTHRVTSKQVAVAGTNSKDIKAVLRAGEADVYTASYTPGERDKFERKIRAVVQSLIDNGIKKLHLLLKLLLFDHRTVFNSLPVSVKAKLRFSEMKEAFAFSAFWVPVRE